MVESKKDMYFYSFIEKSIDGAWRLDFEEPISLTLPVKKQIDLIYKYAFIGEANMAFAEQYGFDKLEKIIGSRLSDLLPREFPDSIDTLSKIIEADYQISGLESTERDITGNKKYFLNNIVGECRQGRLIHLWGTAKDITQQKHLEKEIHLQAQVLQQLPEGCVIVEPISETVLYINPAFTRITGYRLEDIPKNRKLNFLQGLDTDLSLVNELKQAIAKNSDFVGEILNYKKDGQPFWNSMKISPVKDHQGKTTYYVGLFSDVTEQKQLQQKLDEQQSQLEHIARINTMSELTSALAHEINQPLAAILSNAQASLRFLSHNEPDLDNLRDIIEDIVEDDKRAGEIIHRIRRSVSKQPPDFKLLNINQIIDNVYQLIKSKLVYKNIQLVFDLSSELPYIMGDEVQLQQVILNLLLNACQATEQLSILKRAIIIATVLKDNVVEIKVSDSGAGIEAAQLEAIFQPFVSTKKEGMGVGLSINRRIIEEHGGKLWVESPTGKGATFIIQLPITT